MWTAEDVTSYCDRLYFNPAPDIPREAKEQRLEAIWEFGISVLNERRKRTAIALFYGLSGLDDGEFCHHLDWFEGRLEAEIPELYEFLQNAMESSDSYDAVHAVKACANPPP